MKKRYAAHYLTLGDYQLIYPLVEVEGSRLLSVNTFVEEGEHITFLDGTIRLKSPEIQGDGGVIQRISLTELQDLLSSLKDMPQIALPTN